MYRPAPWIVALALPMRVLPVTVEWLRSSGELGLPPKKEPFQMPAPWTAPVRPFAVARLPLILSWSRTSPSFVSRPAPWAVASPAQIRSTA